MKGLIGVCFELNLSVNASKCFILSDLKKKFNIEKSVVKCWYSLMLIDICMLKVKNRNTKTMCKIKLAS